MPHKFLGVEGLRGLWVTLHVTCCAFHVLKTGSSLPPPLYHTTSVILVWEEWVTEECFPSRSGSCTGRLAHTDGQGIQSLKSNRNAVQIWFQKAGMWSWSQDGVFFSEFSLPLTPQDGSVLSGVSGCPLVWYKPLDMSKAKSGEVQREITRVT